MKRLICSIIFCFFGLLSFCQEEQITALGQDNPNASYRLFPTTNMWTFLKLNTEDGRIWQVQYAINNDENRFETYLNLIPLATGSQKKARKIYIVSHAKYVDIHFTGYNKRVDLASPMVARC